MSTNVTLTWFPYFEYDYGHKFISNYENLYLTKSTTVFSIFLGYAIICLLFSSIPYLKNRRAIKIPKYVIITHNFIQVCVSLYMVIGLTYCPLKANYKMFGGNKCFDDDRRRNQYEHCVMAMIRLFVLTKYYDLIDTLLIIIGKKERQFTLLHVSHHCLVGIMLWYGMKYTPSGDSFMPPLVNSLIHFIMYSYYLMNSVGIKIKWKKLVTILQLSQFVFLTIYGLFTYMLGTVDNRTNIVNAIMQLYMLVLFTRFYRSTYKNQNNNKRKKNV